MAIAGSAAPSFEARIEGGRLVLGRQTLRQNVITDVDIAIQELLKGKTVFIAAYGGMAEKVSRTVNMTLALGGKADTVAPIATE